MVLLQLGCSALDVDLAEQNLEEGSVTSGVSELTELAEAGYLEAGLALGDHYLQEKELAQFMLASHWYQQLVEHSDKARLGYIRWLAKYRHYNPELHEQTLRLLERRQSHSKDIAVELSRFVQEYVPEREGFADRLIFSLSKNQNTSTKDILRVIDTLPDPIDHAQLLDSLCAQKQVDTAFYCLRSKVRIAKQHTPNGLPELIRNAVSAFNEERLSAQHTAALVRLLVNEDVGGAQVDAARHLVNATQDQAIAVVLTWARLSLRKNFLSAKETLSLLTPLAKKNIPEAHLLLARLHSAQPNDPRTQQKMVQHLQTALPEPEAQRRLGQIYLRGDLGEGYEERGINYLLNAARQYDLNSYRSLALLFSDTRQPFYDPIYAQIFAGVYRRLGGELTEDQQARLSTAGSKQATEKVQLGIATELRNGLGFTQNLLSAQLFELLSVPGPKI